VCFFLGARVPSVRHALGAGAAVQARNPVSRERHLHLSESASAVRCGGGGAGEGDAGDRRAGRGDSAPPPFESPRGARPALLAPAPPPRAWAVSSAAPASAMQDRRSICAAAGNLLCSAGASPLSAIRPLYWSLPSVCPAARWKRAEP
jgi:hypothetical protein